MMTQTISTRSACSFTIMSGSARITMVLSIAAISAPIVVTLSAIHLYSMRPRAPVFSMSSPFRCNVRYILLGVRLGIRGPLFKPRASLRWRFFPRPLFDATRLSRFLLSVNVTLAAQQ